VKRVAIYCRVSTEEQKVQNQLAVLESLADRRGWQVVAVYQEAESAWRDGQQRELARLVQDARVAKFDTVLVWSLDRLSRQGALAILRLIDRLRHFGVNIISHQESWTEAPGDLAELLYSIAGWVAKSESKRISERTKAGLETRRRQGKPIGRPKGSKDKKKRKRRSRNEMFGVL